MSTKRDYTDLRIKKVEKGRFENGWLKRGFRQKVYAEVVTEHRGGNPNVAYLSISNAYAKRNGELGRNTKKVISKAIRYLSETYGDRESYLGSIAEINISFADSKKDMLEKAFEKSKERAREKHEREQYSDNIFLAARAKRSLPLLKRMSCC